jgi:hypothetical protein
LATGAAAPEHLTQVAGIAKTVVSAESHEMLPLSDLAYGMIEHSGEHYGQLVVYYRVAGMVPPSRVRRSNRGLAVWRGRPRPRKA